LVEALCYKPKSLGFESRWGEFFSMYLPAALWPWGWLSLLTEMSTRNLHGGKGRPARRADNLAAIREPIVYKMWEPRRLTTQWAFTACYRNSFTLPVFYLYRYFRHKFKCISEKLVTVQTTRWIMTNNFSLHFIYERIIWSAEATGFTLRKYCSRSDPAKRKFWNSSSASYRTGIISHWAQLARYVNVIFCNINFHLYPFSIPDQCATPPNC
jgi:hypothetical protein